MKITDSVYLLDSTKGSYVYLIKGEENVLIDTGFTWKGKALLRELKALGAEPRSIKHILITHHDLDHIGNAFILQQSTGASIWASAADIPYITGESPRPGFKKHMSRIFRVKKPQRVRAFSDGGLISGVRVIPSPGHTPGHSCFLYDGVLFAGDLVKNKKGEAIPYPAPWTADSAALKKSIEQIEKCEFDWVCPAHGSPYKREGRRICTAE